MGWMVLLYLLWSSVFPLGKQALAWSTPLFLTGSRMVLASILLLGFLSVKKKLTLSFSKRQWLALLVLSIFSIYLTNVLEFVGLKHLSAAKTCFIYSLSPFFAALFSYIHFKEKMTVQKWIGMVIGSLGFLPVFLLESGSENLLHAFSLFSWPELAVMGAALFSIYGWVLLRLVVKDEGLSPPLANGVSMLLGGSLALVHSLFIDSWSPVPIQEGSFFLFGGNLLITTLVSNVICFNLYGYLLKRYTATLLSLFGLLSPLFASINSYFLIGEKPSLVILLSTSVVALGLWMVYRSEIRQGYLKKKAA